MISILLHLIGPVLFYTSVTTILFQEFGFGALEATALSALFTSPFLFYYYVKDQKGRGESSAVRLRLSGCFLYIVVFGGALCLFGNYMEAVLGLAQRSAAYGEASRALYSPPFAFQLLASGLMIPLVEELIFRGMVFASLRDKLPFFLSAAMSSALFGLFHGNLPQGVYAFVVGIAAAWLYQTCSTLLAPILLHVSANLLSLFVTNTALLGVLSGSENRTALAAKAAVSAAVSAVCAIRIYRKNLKEDIV